MESSYALSLLLISLLSITLLNSHGILDVYGYGYGSSINACTTSIIVWALPKLTHLQVCTGIARTMCNLPVYA